MGIFKACDIRGVYKEELDENLAYRIGRSVGHRVGRRSICVGGDVRPSTPSLKSAAIRGLIDEGCRVVDLGILPTPAIYFAKDHLKTYACLIATASHNPPQYNGFKVMFGNLPVAPEDIEEIERDVGADWDAPGGGTYEMQDVIPEYLGYLRGKLEGPANPMGVVVDAGNGCYGEIAPDFMSELGYRVIPINCEIDGGFPGRGPNPAIPEKLKGLSEAVRRSQADFGVAFDGDGDRVAFVDDLGEVIPADVAIALFIDYLLGEKAPQKVVYDIKCSKIVREAVERHGGIPLVEKSGHAFIKARMIREGAAFGGEVSGHFFYETLGGGDDGLFSACLMGHLISESGEQLSELRSRVPRYTITPDIRIPFPEEDGESVLEHLAKSLRGKHPTTTIDGLRADFPDGWGLVRVSVTEPVLTFRFEATDGGKLRQIVEEFLEASPTLRDEVLRRIA
ncbi:MAG: phosphomannomutase/phosphoglucomutase [bacterium]